ncbi:MULTISPECIES: AraC family transcriptional regulator [Bacillus cereus group]|uniref:AraC family transcriptional regulator n=1 Tax=Bacillus cereus group TaxID=86661 RepID=UPI0010BE6C47|nr:AraC family transcriptional regulator [Bacillus cereus]MBR9660379.1 AraC family transcriptional regulator [Bacillus cereus]MCU4842077.1 AraC family transcriptional regulator [Bacillus cereus]MCU5270930.1 AraC family transcriptional regulator [Bacillus cereus]MCU5348049.1 AraC family transcriptional regulator [Bacillus cereus]TKH69681.1 AraC family transcriptional regulator [Bacillus cereus]
MKTSKVTEWILGGRNPGNYILYNDINVKYTNEVSKKLYSLENHQGYGTSYCFLDKHLYVGKRVKFSGMIMTKSVKEYAGLWIRAEQQEKDIWEVYHINSNSLSVENSWKEYFVILDVPKNIETLSVGVSLKSTGHIWFSSMSVEIVDKKNN